MLSGELTGYKGNVLRLLQGAGVRIGDIIRLTKNSEVFLGSLMPRYESTELGYIVLKLKSGYNVGIRVLPGMRIEKIESGIKPAFVPPTMPKVKSELPKVSVISTGGTICSRVDYRTGGVRPALSADELYSVVPELSEISIIETEILFSLYSENITSKHWSKMAKTAAKYIKKGVAGVVFAHGTDTMAYSAAALSFALQNLPVPVILVGSQRSADRPSSDAAANLTGAVLTAANAPFAEVVLAMHETVSDQLIVLHRGTKVRKCHTTRRDTFQSVNSTPLAHIEDTQIIMLANQYQRRNVARELVLKPNFDEKGALIKFYPNLNPVIIDWHINNGYRGIVLEGTGLGHVSKHCYSSIKKAIKKGVIVAMASQCIWGRVNMNVYDTGRDLLAMGVIPLGDILPETALVKLLWVLGQTKDQEEAKRLLTKNIAHEFSTRTLDTQGAAGRI